MARRLPILLALLLAGPLLAPLAGAGAPEARPWAPYNATSEVSAVALAAEGTTIAAALHKAVSDPSASPTVPGLPGSDSTRVAQTDLAILSTEYGFARNDTTQSVTPLGRTHVAVSRAGHVVASLGNESSLGSSAEGTLQLYYSRVAPGANWSTAAPTEVRIPLAGHAVGLALSDDGNRVAVLTRDGLNHALRGWTWSGSTLTSAFDIRGTGNVTGLAASGGLDRLLVGGQFAVGNELYGGVRMFPFAQSDAIAAWSDTSANGTTVAAVAVSRDARLAAAGSAERLALLEIRGDAFDAPSTLTLGANLTRVAVSDAGERVSAVAGATLHHLDVTAAPREIWNATLPSGNVSALSLNRTGELLVVAIPGTGGGVFAYGEKSAEPIWRFLGDTRGAAINADGTEVAYGQRAIVSSARIPRGITFEFIGPTKTTEPKPIRTAGAVVFEAQVRNPGAAPEQVVFEVVSDPDITVRASPATLLVNPGATERVNLTISIGGALAGPRGVNVTARALTSGAQDWLLMGLVPAPSYDVSLLLDEEEVLTTAGAEHELLLGIVNNGTADLDLQLSVDQSVSQGEPWPVRLQETNISLLRGTRTSVKVEVEAPAEAANGTSTVLTLTLAGENVLLERSVTFRINPSIMLEMNATGRVMFVEPGRSAHYNVTLRNTGSLARDVETFYDQTSADGKSWAVDMETGTFRLEPGAVRTIPVKIVAPANAVPGDMVSVLVTARTLPEQVNETAFVANVTLFANAEAPRPTVTTPTNDSLIPMPAPIAVLATALAAAGLAIRGRRQ